MTEIRPYDWQMPLVARQDAALRKGRIMVSACHTGSGKTVLALATAKDLGMPTLVVCPKVARSQWILTAKRMSVPEGLLLGVTNPEQLVKKAGCEWYSNDDGWKTPDGSLLIFDEVHRGCSGIDSKTGLALARFCNSRRPDNKVLALSATVADSPLKLRHLGYLFGFHSWSKQSFYSWCRAHGCATVRVGRWPRQREAFLFTTNRRRAAEIMMGIRHDMGEAFMTIGPGEIPGFPDEVKEVVRVDLAKSDADALERAYAEMPERIRSGGNGDDMVEILRLRQQAEFCKAGVIADMAADLVEDGNSVFIALNFTDARLRVEESLRKAKVPFASIYGGQRDAERQDGIDAFQANRVHVMVGMMAACSVALSLHDERHERPRVSLISPGYTASEFVQALGRIRRVGGTTAVQKIIIAAGTVEEKVGRSIERKMNNITALNDGDFVR